MAKNWEIKDGSSLLIRSYTEKQIKEGKEVQVKVCADLVMDLTDLFPEFLSFDEVQRNCVINGLKQKLDDAIARSKDQSLTEAEKREVQEALWLRISAERKWNAEGKETGSRGPSVSLALIVPPLLKAGYTAESLAKLTGKKLEVVQKFIETGEEEVSE
jgi:hypothetical protein